MKRLIDLLFCVVFALIAVGCVLTYIVTKEPRMDLAVYGSCSLILSIMMLKGYINRTEEA